MSTGRDSTAESILYVPGEPQVKTAGGEVIDSPFESDYNLAEETELTDAQDGDVELPDHDAEDTIPGADQQEKEENKGDQQPDAPDPVTVAPDGKPSESTPDVPEVTTTEETTVKNVPEPQKPQATEKPAKSKDK